MISNCSAIEGSWESLGQQEDQTSPSERKSTLNTHQKDWCWSSNTLATWCKEPVHWKRPWFWEKLKAGEGGDRGWDCWMASFSQWTWVWANSGRYWRAGKPGVLQSLELLRVGHNLASEQQITYPCCILNCRRWSGETALISFLFTSALISSWEFYSWDFMKTWLFLKGPNFKYYHWG